LQGIQSSQLELSTISTEQFIKWYKGNDIWALAIVETAKDDPPTSVPSFVSQVLEEFSDIFAAPSELPPHKEYDHAIPLLPDVVPVNARPYRYSPLHKDEIERQVREMLQLGLITTSTSPFASPMLLVQKKMALGAFVRITEASMPSPQRTSFQCLWWMKSCMS
jgi:hypothetical protein